MHEIPLTQGKVALVDDEDFARVSQYRWFAHRDCHSHHAYYVHSTDRSGTKVRTMILHRFIMGAAIGEIIDHRNGDTLDCRKGNLRRATRSGNRANAEKHKGSSRYKGVCLHHGRWVARIRCNKRLMRLGAFDNPVEAALAYDEKARELHGDFVRTNASLGLLDGGGQ